MADEDKPTPFCRDTPFKSGVASWDLNMAQAVAEGGWCKQCLARMPKQLADYIAYITNFPPSGGVAEVEDQAGCRRPPPQVLSTPE